jgi:toxin YoeB
VNVTFTPKGWSSYEYWAQHDRKMLVRINALIDDTVRRPFTGLGKPEPLRNEFSGWWSRRITQEHRLVYRVTGKGHEQTLEIAACRFHYG